MSDINKNWKFDKFLGEGRTCSVYRAIDKITKEYKAIKVINLEKIAKEESVDIKIAFKMVKEEIDILKSLDHPNIVKLTNHFQKKCQCYIIMEYVKGVELFEKIGKGLKENKSKKYFRQICTAVKYCHSMDPPLIHGDLKLENIMIDQNDNIKIIDFGLSKYQINNYIEGKCGTSEYLPPEAIKECKYDGKSFDIWSLGIILYAMTSGMFPNEVVEKKIHISTDIIFPDECKCSQKCKTLITKMLLKRAELRPTIDEILSDPWFFNIDKHKIFLTKLPKIDASSLSSREIKIVRNYNYPKSTITSSSGTNFKKTYIPNGHINLSKSVP